MKDLPEIIEAVMQDRDIRPDQVPALDLYMDQVLTLFNEGLRENKRHPENILHPVLNHKYTDKECRTHCIKE